MSATRVVCVLAAVLSVGAGARSLRAVVRPDLVAQQSARRLCHDADGGGYSSGAMVRVHEQIQQCEDGKWTFPVDDPPEGAEKLANQKSCLSAGAKDKGQEYGSGLFHASGGAFERCDDGKWAKNVK